MAVTLYGETRCADEWLDGGMKSRSKRDPDRVGSTPAVRPIPN